MSPAPQKVVVLLDLDISEVSLMLGTFRFSVRTTVPPAPSLETNVRLLLAALTVGAAGIGYVYVQQSTAPAAEPEPAPKAHLYDWQSANDTLSVVASDPAEKEEDPPLVVRDTINSVHKEVTSTLDEFVRTSDKPSTTDAPSDIVSQAAPAAATTATPDPELVPFATSENPPADTSEIVPADANAAINQTPVEIGAQETPIQEPLIATTPAETPAIDTAAKESSPPPSQPVINTKPTINEATLVTKKPTDQPRTSRETTKPKEPATATSRPKTELLPGKPVDKGSLVDADWKVIGKTATGLPMHSRRYGRQGTRTLIIAGLDGQDLVGTRWNDELADVLVRRLDLLQNQEIMIVRAGNPEGLTRKMAPNSQGVLINRNFPSRRYQLLSDKSTGTGPASEPETKAILEVLYSFRPRRVIHLASTTGQTSIQCNRAAKEVADELQKQLKLNVQPLDVELIPGSIEDFADGTLDAAVVSLKLNVATEWQQAWKKHSPTVLTAINGKNPDKLLAVSDERPGSNETGMRIPNLDEEQPPIVKRRRGYEELPPPPR